MRCEWFVAIIEQLKVELSGVGKEGVEEPVVVVDGGA